MSIAGAVSGRRLSRLLVLVLPRKGPSFRELESNSACSSRIALRRRPRLSAGVFSAGVMRGADGGGVTVSREPAAVELTSTAKRERWRGAVGGGVTGSKCEQRSANWVFSATAIIERSSATSRCTKSRSRPSEIASRGPPRAVFDSRWRS
jgi:hypothetical protein